jgi:fengycin family lipopeptide synthetase D
LGRIDNQVKIRGFRIEPGEIENQLLKTGEIKEAVVLVREVNKEKVLCAYFVSLSGEKVKISELKERLAVKLPQYMIPAYFMQLDKFPLIANWKIDRKALPMPEIVTNEVYVAPGDEVEKKLVDIWAGVLNIEKEKISIDVNFFEIGGHSLNAVAMISRVHKEFNVQVPLAELFQALSVKDLAVYIKEADRSRFAAIEPVKKKKYYALSPAQKRLYILHQVEMDNTAYNIHAALLLEGRVDRDRFAQVFKELVERHESLRTSFEIIEGEPVQRIHDKVEFEIKVLRGVQGGGFSKEPPWPPEAFIRGFNRPFDLSQAPLLRVGLGEIAEGHHILMLNMHHIISDGTSIDIFEKEFTSLYRGESLRPLRIQYKDYSQWLNERREEGVLKEQEAYWLNEFDEEVPVLELPIDYPRPALQCFDGGVLRFEVDSAVKKALKALAGGEGATLFMVLLAIFNIFLAKLSGGEEIVIGTPVEGRNHEDLRQVIGMFVNTLALKNVPGGSKTFKGFLKDIKTRTLAAFENRDYPFEELVEQVTVKRDAGRNPLFDVMFVMEESGRTEIDLGDLKLKPYEYESRKVKFDMVLRAINIEDGLCFELDYCTALFKRETVERFIVYFKKILASVLESPGKPIHQLEIITAEEKRQILFEFNDDRAEYRGGRTVNDMFESLVERKPGHIAAVFEDSDSVRSRAVTYGELNERAGRLAAVLRAQGLKTNAPAALMVERSLEMVVGIMGILKAGGAYLPLDAGLPLERINYILEDSEAAVLLTREHLFKKDDRYFQQLHLKNIIFLDDERIYTGDAGAPEMNIQPFHLAYVLYTSGTTGQPRGVMVEHGNVCNLAAGLKQKIYDRYFNPLNVCLVSPYVFDASVKQIFAVLLLGHTLYIVPEETRMDGRLLLAFYQRHQVDISDGTPAHIRLLTEAVGEAVRCRVKHFLIGGEALPRQVVERFFERFAGGVRILNVYGPTECTVDATLFDLPGEHILEGGTIPIGKPMPNVQVYILDSRQRLQPVGITGELWIGGAGVARGYINRPLLTAEKFFLRGQQKMYRSGDLGRWLPDGNIEFVGRVDRQVKIRGSRIELEEIENRLLHEEGITGAVVIVREDKEGTGYLCAYITAGQRMDASALKTRLSRVLPGYMIPAFILQLEKMPLTRNGKLNRKALPIPEIPVMMGDYEAPRDPVQEKIAAIYSEVLEIEKGAVSISSSFFDLGGHSLKATLMTAKIHKAFNVRVPLAQVFKAPTVKELAGYVKKAGKQRYASAAAAEKREYYPLSSAQKRLYIIQQIQGEYAVYNTPSVVKVSGVLEKQKMETAFIQLINRHESLRTCFEMIDGEPMQRIHPGVEFEVEYYELAGGNAAEGEDQAIIKQFIRPFDLSQAPLIRVGLITVTEQEHILMIDMHHIVSDAISLRIFINDFFDLYSGQRLEPLALQYKDFSQWHNSDRQQEEIKKQEAYWLRVFDGAIPGLDMPLDFPRPTVYRFEGDIYFFTIDRALTHKLRHMVEETGVTLNILFLAAYNVLLSRYTTQQDLIVGIPVSGRRHIELQSIIGFFANMLAMRNQPRENKTFRVFLEEVKENSLKAYENQDYQFDELIWKLKVQRKPGRHPMVDTVLVVRSRENRNEEIMEINRQGLKMVPYRFKWEISHFDLMLHGVETRDSIDMLIEYGTLLFKKSTIEELAKHFIDILEQVAANPDLKIKEIKIAHDFLSVQPNLFYDDQDDWIERLAKSA